jgi:hypothetical protein
MHPLKVLVHQIHFCFVICLRVYEPQLSLWMQLQQFCCILCQWCKRTNFLCMWGPRFAWMLTQSSTNLVQFSPLFPYHMPSVCSVTHYNVTCYSNSLYIYGNHILVWNCCMKKHVSEFMILVTWTVFSPCIIKVCFSTRNDWVTEMSDRASKSPL